MHATLTLFVNSLRQHLLATDKGARFLYYQGDRKGTPLPYTSKMLPTNAPGVYGRGVPLRLPWPLAICRLLAIAFVILYLAVMVSSCSLPGQTQSQPPDAHLKFFHILSAHILTLDAQAEVDGTIINTNTYKYPFDVSLVATFYDLKGNVIGSAQGTAEDVWPGTTRPFTLLGQVDSSKYSRMVVTPVSLRERRIEKNLPTPPPVIP